ncbi:MAG: hypothetical protein D6739_10600 [Nitrospirae bacterium]|nr:MAG: hypothetical protein D6739_10600 [Nitrospirota bacterium]
MEHLLATLWVYRRCLGRAASLFGRTLPAAAAVALYAAALGVVQRLALPLGMAGGLVVTLAACALASSYLYLVGQALRLGRVNLVADGRRGLTAHLAEVVNLGFLLWVASFAVRLLAAQGGGPALRLGFAVVVFVVGNVLPELVYQRPAGAAALVAESYRFVVSEGLAWFPPTLAAAAAGYLVVAAAGRLPLPYPVAELLRLALWGGAVHAVMLFRGCLFAELSATGARGRLFRYRARR